MYTSVYYETSVSAQQVFKKLRDSGREVVLLHGKPWSFVGVVNPKIVVPNGEAGLRFIREYVARSRSKHEGRVRKEDMSPFAGGFVGFVSYDLGLDWMGIERGPEYPHIVPDARFVYVDEVYAVHEKNNAPEMAPAAAEATASNTTISDASSQNSELFREYCAKIDEIKELLYAGETYQVNFSRFFERPYSGDAFELFTRLNELNPSPMQFFMETKDWALISNSPERLFSASARSHDNVIHLETRPIKGTVPRGATPEEDRRNIKRLLESEKESAELSMIVDLSRNDLGKVAKPGTLRVREHRAIQKLSHVIHTYSTIVAELAPGLDWFDCLQAFFPGGSITGCPKKRTMEIIKRLEGRPRGAYCGSAGYIGLDGSCDFNIMIRTLWLDKLKKSVVYNTGGGIVIDSDSHKEFQETEHKAAACLKALTDI